jgi:hypothetical protein
LEVSKAVCLALKDFNFGMETFCLHILGPGEQNYRGLLGGSSPLIRTK